MNELLGGWLSTRYGHEALCTVLKNVANTTYQVQVAELPLFVLILTIVDDLKQLIRNALCINRAVDGCALIDQSNKDDHAMLYLPPNA